MEAWLSGHGKCKGCRKEERMKSLGVLCCSAVLVSTFAGCKMTPRPPPDAHDADVKAISDDEAQWNKGYAARDVNKIAAHYADDAVLMVPDMDPDHGKDAIHKVGEELLKDPALTLQFRPTGSMWPNQATWTMPAVTRVRISRAARAIEPAFGPVIAPESLALCPVHRAFLG